MMDTRKPAQPIHTIIPPSTSRSLFESKDARMLSRYGRSSGGVGGGLSDAHAEIMHGISAACREEFQPLFIIIPCQGRSLLGRYKSI